METVSDCMVSLRPLIEDIISRTGTAGLTYGIIHNGIVAHTESFGYRDIEDKVPMNEDTIVQVASLSKGMLAAAVGVLVEESRLNWDTPIKDILPDWHLQDPTVHNLTTIVDCLSHRTGLQMNNYWIGTNNNIIIPLESSMQLINGLKPVKPFRGQFQYNNLGYEIVSHVIRKLSGLSWNEFFQSHIFDPLEMTRTGTHENFAGSENVSNAYGALSNASPVRIGNPQIGGDTVGGAGGGVRSTLNDMLKLAKAWLSSAEHQYREGSTSTPGSPLKHVATILSGQIPIGKSSYHETSYAMGFARTQLPGPLGATGLNGKWLNGVAGTPHGFPLVGKGARPQLVIYHQGSNPGVLSALILLPETQSAIVVLTNTLALVDTADWVSQLLLETLLNVPQKNDYLQLTKNTVSKALAWFDPMYRILREGRSSEPPRSLESYVGVYWNAVKTFHIDVALVNEQLSIAFQGLPSQGWALYHWERDIFTWLPDSRDELAGRGRFTFQSLDYYKIRFSISMDNQVQSLIWIHEGWNVPNGEEFFRYPTMDSLLNAHQNRVRWLLDQTHSPSKKRVIVDPWQR